MAAESEEDFNYMDLYQDDNDDNDDDFTVSSQLAS